MHALVLGAVALTALVVWAGRTATSPEGLAGRETVGEAVAATEATPAAAVQIYGDPGSYIRAPVAITAIRSEAVIRPSVAANQAQQAQVSPATPVVLGPPAARQTATAVTAVNAAQAAPTAAPTPRSLQQAGPAGASPTAAASPPATPTSAPPPPPTPTPRPEPFMVKEHEVRPGETLRSIAAQYGLTTETMRVANILVANPDSLKIGQRLWVPGADGVLYFVEFGDNVSDIARRHGTTSEAIVSFAPNRLADANALRTGELIMIPGGRRPAPAPPPQAAPTAAPPTAAPPRATPTPAPPVRAATPTAAARPSTPPPPPPPTPRPPTPAPPRPASSGFIWPITGPISSYFGPSHPLGIDIDLYGRAGTPIVAARGGTVTFAGGNPCCSYGYYVDLDNGDGYRTRYAHFQSPPPVRIGQRVEQGQVVGYAGTTGYSTGVHLHFEVTRNGATVSPMAVLP